VLPVYPIFARLSQNVDRPGQKALSLFRDDFAPELKGLAAPLELRAVFLNSPQQESVVLSERGWEEMIGNVKHIEVMLLKTPGGDLAGVALSIGSSLPCDMHAKGWSLN
jgi:hypothetical protein